MAKRTAAAMALALLAGLCGFAPAAVAGLPYATVHYDPGGGTASIIQPVYIPSHIVGGAAPDGSDPFRNPSDLFIAGDDHVYVADRGNHRVVELDERGRLVRVYGTDGEGKLRAPEGVFVAENGDVYVADTGNKRIAVFDREGNFLRQYGRPESDLLPADYNFVPVKLVVDGRGVMYAASQSAYQGLVRIAPDGGFAGFYGANRTPLTLLDRLKRALFTEEQKRKEAANRPPAVTNLTLDPNGFIVTVSSAARPRDQIRRLNPGGRDTLRGAGFTGSVVHIQNTLERTPTKIPVFNLTGDVKNVDAAVDKDLFLYTVDTEKGLITILDKDGARLFGFGGKSGEEFRMGLLGAPSSIAVNSRGDIWVADARTHVLQVFVRTAFGETVMTAIALFYEGRYEESMPYWDRVAAFNDMIDLAYRAYGKMAMKRGEYAEALQYFRMGRDAQGYSDAFWEVRYRWLRGHFLALLAVPLAAAAVLRFAAVRFRKRRRRMRLGAGIRRFGEETAMVFRLLRHPYDGFYWMKERRVSWPSLAAILAAAALAGVGRIYFRGFAFYPVDREYINYGSILLYQFVPWLTWVIANYLVSTVKDGEGRFREVFQASVYAFAPFIVLSVPSTLLTNVLALEEGILFYALDRIMWMWMGVLLVVMTQVIHNFDFTESVRNSGVTAAAIAILWIFAVIVAGLVYNLFNFFYEVYKEASLYV